jgi:hypothetical protein
LEELLLHFKREVICLIEEQYTSIGHLQITSMQCIFAIVRKSDITKEHTLHVVWCKFGTFTPDKGALMALTAIM